MLASWKAGAWRLAPWLDGQPDVHSVAGGDAVAVAYQSLDGQQIATILWEQRGGEGQAADFGFDRDRAPAIAHELGGAAEVLGMDRRDGRVEVRRGAAPIDHRRVELELAQVASP